MVYGFVLIYLHDFASGKEAWIAASLTGPDIESVAWFGTAVPRTGTSM
jgi:hypothetical protein